MKIRVLAIVAAIVPLCTGAFAGQLHAVPLASVAQQLGLRYAYLDADDEVSLTGHGLAIVVRPGGPYFTVNDRMEPVEGDVPRYQSGDLLISPQFARQLAMLERAAAKTEMHARAKTVALSAAIVADAASSANAQARRVFAVRLAQVPGSEDVSVSGEATPGAVVAIVLKADVAPELPTIYLNRSFAIAGTDGHYALDVPTAPNYFTGSALVAEASGSDDSAPMTARFSPKGK